MSKLREMVKRIIKEETSIYDREIPNADLKKALRELKSQWNHDRTEYEKGLEFIGNKNMSANEYWEFCRSTLGKATKGSKETILNTLCKFAGFFDKR